jgi:hypothetical protein
MAPADGREESLGDVDAAFLGAAFLAAFFLGADFLAEAFLALAPDFLGAAFFAAFLAPAFLGLPVVFFTAIVVVLNQPTGARSDIHL